MLGSEVPPWRTMILDGGQLVGALVVCAASGAVVGFEPEGSEFEAPGVVAAAAAGTQLDVTAFFLCRGCVVDVERVELAGVFAGVEVCGGVDVGEVS
jgi:hypothetical protein